MNELTATFRLFRHLFVPNMVLAALPSPQVLAQEEVQLPAQTEAQAQAAEALVPDRPGFGDSPSTVPAGFFLLEAGYDFTHDGDEYTHDAPVLLFRAGLTPKIEARVGWDGYRSNGTDGALNARVGFKIDALDQQGFVPDLAVIPEVVIPTGDDDVASDKVEPELRFAGGYDLTDSLAVGGNLNFAGRRGESTDERFFEFAGSTVLGVAFTSSFGGYVEYFGILPDDPEASDNHAINSGLTYIIGGNVQIDAFGGAGLDGDADDVFAGGGIAFVW